jgi:hypothetical protein
LKKSEPGEWPDEPWIEDDRLWFEARPGRLFRIRRSPSEEKILLGNQINCDARPSAPTNGRPFWDYTIVIQVHPGVRMRHFILLFDYIESPDLHWPDDKAAAAFAKPFLR